jgi:hypothetical protein
MGVFLKNQGKQFFVKGNSMNLGKYNTIFTQFHAQSNFT